LPSISLTLLFNVASDRCFIDANRRDKVAFRPNTVSAPVNLFQEWKLGLESSGCVSFDQSNNLTNRPLRWDRDEQMDVILVSVDCFEDEIRVVLFDGLDPDQQEGLDASVDDLASVFGWQHNVEVTDKGTVGLTAIDSLHQVL